MRVRVGGVTVQVTDDASIPDAVRAAGVSLPTLCHDDRLTPAGSCRACLVRAGGKVVTACVTPVSEGVAIEVGAGDLRALRREAAEVIVSALPPRALDDEHGGSELARVCHELRVVPETARGAGGRGRDDSHYSGGMTRRTDNLRLDPTDRLGVHPVDAARHALSEGDRVLVRSRHGRAHLIVQISDDMAPGQVFCAFHFPASGVNALTSDRGDTATSCPEYKVTAVRLERVPTGERPGQASQTKSFPAGEAHPGNAGKGHPAGPAHSSSGGGSEQ